VFRRLQNALPGWGLAVLALTAAGAAQAADEREQSWGVSGQATYVWQQKSALAAAYSGPNSLGPARELSYSFTATLALGLRPWAGAELYLDPELAQGVPLANLTGLGGFTNGEIARSSGPTLKLYRARLFGRQTWALAGDDGQPAPTEAVEADLNQLAGRVAMRRIVLTVGNISVADLFDDNAYSHDPRSQFLNWSLMAMGAYDYAADARGYTTGAALEWYHDDWALRAGRFALPREPNQQSLDPKLLQHFGDQLELEHSHSLAGQPGRLRALLFHSRTRLARFDDALALARQTGSTPDINAVRNRVQDKTGWGLGLEQALSPQIGLFARWSQADGQTETDAFTEIDRSLSAGLLVDGAAWQRAGDSLGLGFAHNELSKARRHYLAAGGISFFIGDGALRYRPEQVLEAFYKLQVVKGVTVSLNGQRILNPAYNADRGPVNFIATRLHLAF
jgi:high affinity Mn2+ porin